MKKLHLSKLLSKLKKPAAFYYILRIAQRFGLLTQGLLAAIYWLLLINIVVANTFAQETVNHQWRNPTALNNTINIAYNALQRNFLLAAGVAVTLTMILAFLPRVRRYEKRLLVDSVVIIAFCVVSVLVAQRLITSFIQGHLT